MAMHLVTATSHKPQFRPALQRALGLVQTSEPETWWAGTYAGIFTERAILRWWYGFQVFSYKGGVVAANGQDGGASRDVGAL
jgi:hypothetical protein